MFLDCMEPEYKGKKKKQYRTLNLSVVQWAEAQRFCRVIISLAT